MKAVNLAKLSDRVKSNLDVEIEDEDIKQMYKDIADCKFILVDEKEFRELITKYELRHNKDWVSVQVNPLDGHTESSSSTDATLEDLLADLTEILGECK